MNGSHKQFYCSYICSRTTIRSLCRSHTDLCRPQLCSSDIYFQENYDESFVQRVYSSPLLSISEVMSGAKPEAQAVRIQYENKISYKVLAKKLGIMDDLKVRLCPSSTFSLCYTIHMYSNPVNTPSSTHSVSVTQYTCTLILLTLPPQLIQSLLHNTHVL